MSKDLLTIERLTVKFTGAEDGFVALRDVNLSLRHGRTIGLVGESGSGKSLTALSILGLTPAGASLAQQGRIVFDSVEIAGADEQLLRHIRGGRIGIVFQEPMSCLNPLMRVGTQIREVLRAHGSRSRREEYERVIELLTEVGLPDPKRRYRSYPHELSGGQQQRVMIAIALAVDPDLLIADEPTTALDVTIQVQIIELLLRLQRTRGMAMLFISHDLGLVGKIADDIAVMYRGEVVEQGPATELLQAAKHSYTRNLLAARPHASPRLAGQAIGASEMLSAEVQTVSASIVLEVENLVVDYRPGKAFAPRIRAVDGVSLFLESGRTLGLVGESGSGKSTLARAIVGLVPPQSGRLRLFGRNPVSLDAPERREVRRRCQLIFQNPLASLNPRLTVQQILEEPLEVHDRLPRHGVVDFLGELLNEVGLEGRHLGRYPHQLSGGQRQRVCIARALALGPEILICDEIVSALDVTVQAQILKLLLDVQQRRGLAILFITHDLHVVRYLSDGIAVMKAGRLVEAGRSEEVFDHPSHPYTRELLHAASLFA